MIAKIFIKTRRNQGRDYFLSPSPPRKGVSMTTQFEGSLKLQGKTVDLTSAVHLPPISEAETPAPAPKKKRGRPRKAIPLDALAGVRVRKSETTSQTNDSSVSVKEKPSKRASKSPSGSRLRKKNGSKSDFLEDDFFDLELCGEDTPFFEDELSTLEEFERMSKSIGRNKERSGNQKRVDKASGTPTPIALPRRKKVARRRQIDPATCERDYTTDEIEFMNALSEYKRSSGRMFPTCSEILEVLRGLGYEKRHETTDED